MQADGACRDMPGANEQQWQEQAGLKGLPRLCHHRPRRLLKSQGRGPQVLVLGGVKYRSTYASIIAPLGKRMYSSSVNLSCARFSLF